MMFTSSVQVGGAGAPPLPPPPQSDVQQTLFSGRHRCRSGGTSIDNLSITLREGSSSAAASNGKDSAERPTGIGWQTISIVADAADGKQRAVIPPARLATERHLHLPA